MDIWYILWYIFPHFGIMYQEKSGNPVQIGFSFFRFFQSRQAYLDNCAHAFQDCFVWAASLSSRVARLFSVKYTKTWRNVQKRSQHFQMATQYNKCPLNIPNGHKIYQYFPFQGPPKYTQGGIFGMKIFHLASLLPSCFANAKDSCCCKIVSSSFFIISKRFESYQGL
jgi:hypothetical protein